MVHLQPPRMAQGICIGPGCSLNCALSKLKYRQTFMHNSEILRTALKCLFIKETKDSYKVHVP